MKYDIITIGGATEDITFYTKEGVLMKNKKDILGQNFLAFKYGSKIKVDKSYSTFGGGAANAAINFSGLGFNTASLLAVGVDERGNRVINNLKKNKINTKLVQRIKNKETGFSFLLVGPENEHVVFSSRASNSDLNITSLELKELKKTEWIYMTSLSGKWEEILRKVFSIKRVKIAWNPGHIQFKAGVRKIGKFLKNTSVLFFNKDEAAEFVYSSPKYKNKNKKFFNDTKNLLIALKDMGSEIVVITNGKYGADAYNGIKFYHQDILKEKNRVDTTGVGDAFSSSFIAGLELYNGDIQKAMHLGVKTTASVISKQGAQNGLLKISDL